MPRNPPLRVMLPGHLASGVCAGCGERYADFRAGFSCDAAARMREAKRAITRHDGDGEWYWSRRTLLWVLRYVKTQRWIARHMHCVPHA